MDKSISQHVCGCLIALAICIPSFAKSRPKLFPANHGSVLLENQYADSAGIERYSDGAALQADIDSGTLVPVPITVQPKLPEFRRYVRRSAAEFMLELDTRFYLATGHFLIVDSAVRPVNVQRRLCRHNRNAAPANGMRASSHERGTTFDLAKKVFGPGHYDRMTKSQYRLLMMWLAYYQGTGRIHVIEERACLHIMVREDYDQSLQVVSERPIESVDVVDYSVDAGTPPDPSAVLAGQSTTGALPWQF